MLGQEREKNLSPVGPDYFQVPPGTRNKQQVKDYIHNIEPDELGSFRTRLRGLRYRLNTVCICYGVPEIGNDLVCPSVYVRLLQSIIEIKELGLPTVDPFPVIIALSSRAENIGLQLVLNPLYLSAEDGGSRLVLDMGKVVPSLPESRQHLRLERVTRNKGTYAYGEKKGNITYLGLNPTRLGKDSADDEHHGLLVILDPKQKDGKIKWGKKSVIVVPFRASFDISSCFTGGVFIPEYLLAERQKELRRQQLVNPFTGEYLGESELIVRLLSELAVNKPLKAWHLFLKGQDGWGGLLPFLESGNVHSTLSASGDRIKDGRKPVFAEARAVIARGKESRPVRIELTRDSHLRFAISGVPLVHIQNTIKAVREHDEMLKLGSLVWSPEINVDKATPLSVITITIPDSSERFEPIVDIPEYKHTFPLDIKEFGMFLLALQRSRPVQLEPSIEKRRRGRWPRSRIEFFQELRGVGFL